MNYESHSSFKHKIRSSFCFSCCFRRSKSAANLDYERPQSLVRSSSAWIRSKAHDLPDIREKYRTLASRMGRHHRRGQSADYRYDPLSYALNFDEGNGGDDSEFVDQDVFRYRNFSSRLPATPPQPTAAPPAVGVACS